MGSQGRDLVSPRIPALGEAVQKYNQRALPGDDAVEVDPVGPYHAVFTALGLSHDGSWIRFE
jgi:hypothetical protein